MEKKCSIIADFSIIPVGQGETSIGCYVAEVLKSLRKVKGLDYEVTPMGTVLEASNIDIILEAVKTAHEALIAKGVLRIESNLRIDDRRDKARTMKDKVDSVKGYMNQK